MSKYSNTIRTAISFGLDWVPIVGNVKGAIECATGKDFIAGCDLSPGERVFAGVSSIPFGQVTKLGKVTKIENTRRFQKICKGMKNAERVIDLADKGKSTKDLYDTYIEDKDN